MSFPPSPAFLPGAGPLLPSVFTPNNLTKPPTTTRRTLPHSPSPVHLPLASASPSPSASPTTASSPSSSPSLSPSPLLLRAVRGEPVERPPVWLMRQAGRYMSAFREYSDRLPFRERSEAPDIAYELSMQPYRAFQTDGVIMFSDILTPLPAVGVEFDIQPKTGPVIANPLRTLAQARDVAAADFDPAGSLPFVAELLDRLRADLEDEPTTLLGFVGAPFTLAAYAIEGRGCKNLIHTKSMIYGGGDGGETLQTILDAFADLVGEYAVFQADHGAQVVQFFDSWAHHLSPEQYRRYALPAARRSLEYFKARRPDTPAIFFANGSAGKLEHIVEALDGVIDALQLDWAVSMADARKRLGDGITLQGNVDPTVLTTGSEEEIRRAVRECVAEAGGRHVLNLGHGVIKETPEEAVAAFCDEARKCHY